MGKNWYPEKLMVCQEGTADTYDFMRSVFARERHFVYAELGIYMADTAKKVCDLFPNSTLHLFDYHAAIENAQKKLSRYSNRVHYYGNTQKYNDSYNWSLLKIIRDNDGAALFDYCFLDGAHTVAIDALSFFLCDKLLKVGGYVDFDDYGWKLRGSSLDPSKVSVIADQYTDEQIDSPQVMLIVNELVRRDRRYTEIVKDKIFQKVAD